MKPTRQVTAGVLIAGLLAMSLALPQAAEAGGRHWNRGGHGYHHHHSGAYPYPFWGGLAVGAVSGLVVGGIFAPRVVYAAPPVVYQPAPVVVQPAPVVCSSYWVNPYWTGYQWVPGYWAPACR